MSTMVVIRAYKTERMKAHAHYVYHTACWDTKEQSENKELWITGKPLLSSQLSTEQTSIYNGFVRLVPLANIAINATCCECQELLR